LAPRSGAGAATGSNAQGARSPHAYRTRHGQGRLPRAVLSRGARSSPWPVSHRRRRAGPAAIGPHANGLMRLASVRLSRRSRRVMSGVFYNQAARKPPKSRSWLNAAPAQAAPEKMAALTTLYAPASALAAASERVLSTDARTGIQALERQH